MKIQKQRLDENEVDFNSAARRALFGKEVESKIPGAGKSAAARPNRHLRVKVTMNIDGDVLSYFKHRALEEGRSYQVLINDALRDLMEGTRPERLARVVGKILLDDPSFLDMLERAISNKRCDGGDPSVKNLDIVEPVES